MLAHGIAIVIRAALTAPLFNDLDRPRGDWIKAIAFGAINTLVLWAVTLGVGSELVE